VFFRRYSSVLIRVLPWLFIRVHPCSSVTIHPCSSVFFRGYLSVFIRVLPWLFIRCSSVAQGRNHAVARPKRDQPTSHLPAGIHEGTNEFTVLEERERFVRERRESRKSAENANQEKSTLRGAKNESLPRRSHDDAERQTTQDVHDKRAVWKKWRGEALDQRRQPVATDRSESPAKRDK
jgi:hypothetical protein